MDPQDRNPTNNEWTGAPAQNMTTSQNGGSVQQGGYGLVGGVAQQGFGGAVPGGQFHAQAYPPAVPTLRPHFSAMDPQDGSPTNNGRSSAPAQNATASINGGSVPQGGYGLVGGVVQQGFGGAVPGNHSQAQAYAVRPQPGLNPQAAVFLPHQNHSVPGQQPAPQPAHFAYHSHQNGQPGPGSPPAVPHLAFPSFSHYPSAQSFQVSEVDLDMGRSRVDNSWSQNGFAGQQQPPRLHNTGGVIPNQGATYGYTGVNIGYGQHQDANSFNVPPNHPILPHNNGAHLQVTYYPSDVPTSGPPASAGITSSGFDGSRNPYAPPAVTRETQRQNSHLQLHRGRGQIRRHGHAVGSRQKRGSRQYHRELLHLPEQSQQPSVPHPYTSQGSGLPGPIIPEHDVPLSSIEQEITQPNHCAPGPTQPDETMNSEPGQPLPSALGPSQPVAAIPSANNDLGEFDPMHETNPLAVIRCRFRNWLQKDWPWINPTKKDADDKFDTYWIEQLNLDGDVAQQPGAGNQGYTRTIQAVAQSVVAEQLPPHAHSLDEIGHFTAILHDWFDQDRETLRIGNRDN